MSRKKKKKKKKNIYIYIYTVYTYDIIFQFLLNEESHVVVLLLQKTAC